MPNKGFPWNFQLGWGNPTKSSQVNGVIAAVKTKETRGVGKPSSARRPLQAPEFENIIGIARAKPRVDIKYGEPTVPIKANAFIQTTMRRDILSAEEFLILDQDGKLGTHSVRKWATTRARRCGCQKEEVDARARWKEQGQQRVYADLELPWPDGHVAEALCVGGAIMYNLRAGSEITDDWILSNVVPNISKVYHRSIALIFGKAILWGCFDEHFKSNLPQSILNGVQNGLGDITDGIVDTKTCACERIELRTGLENRDARREEELRGAVVYGTVGR